MLLTDNLFHPIEMQGVVACWVNIDLFYTDKWNSTYNSLVAHLSPIKTEEHGHAPKILISSLQLLVTCWPKRLWAGLLHPAVSAFTLCKSSSLAHVIPFPLSFVMMMRVVGCRQVGGKNNYLFLPSPTSFQFYLVVSHYLLGCILVTLSHYYLQSQWS